MLMMKTLGNAFFTPWKPCPFTFLVGVREIEVRLRLDRRLRHVLVYREWELMERFGDA
jgi:hypothetical protein